MKRAILLALLLAACSPNASNQESHVNPPKLNFISSTDRYVAEAAQVSAHPNYETFSVMDTHSMEPFLDKTMDVMVDTVFPFEKLEVDDIVLYKAVWLPEDSPPVCHRLNAKDGNTLIVSGDNNAQYERGIYGVTKSQYIGKVVLVMVLNK